jgi:flavin-dependent dehydrogenase
MAGDYDVVIIGAGPAGAMAAKTAAEIGLRTVVIERKRRPADIFRSCTMMFAVESEYYFGERMYYNDATRKMVFPVNGLTVDYAGPVRDFYAWHFYAPDGESRLEFGDYESSREAGKKGRLSFVFDKGELIEGLLVEAKRYGAEVRTGRNVEQVRKTSRGVEVEAGGHVYRGVFAIGADGIASRTAELMGFNRNREYLGRGGKKSVIVRGLRMRDPESVNFIVCPLGDGTLPFWVGPTADGQHMIDFKHDDDLERLVADSPFSRWFTDIQITKTRSYVLPLWAPVDSPCRDNVLLAGDAAYFAEAEITGSMMCGWRAANAVAVALRDGKTTDDGVDSYREWWRRSYVDSADYREFLLMMLFIKSIFTSAEVTYLYRLIDRPLAATLDPFKVVRLVKEAVEPSRPRISAEMPSLLKKLDYLDVANYEQMAAMMKKRLADRGS